MSDYIVEISEDFWNVRGSFKLVGLIEIGTQCSLVRLASGRFVLLDSYAADDETHRAILERTDGGRAVEAVLNLHPFHTVHCEEVARRFPNAQHFGTARHKRVAPGVPWQELETDQPELWERYAEDFSFTVPRGVEFIPSNEKLHFASVLAVHPRSGALHVDDTLTYSTVPLMKGLSFHPTLSQVLERRPGAASDFRAWAEELIATCQGVSHLCTAHMRRLPPEEAGSPSVAEQVRAAYAKLDDTLDKHARRHG